MVTPDLSSVVVVADLPLRAGPCLESLFRQELGDRLEILLVLCGSAEAADVPGSAHPSVRPLRLPPGTTFSAARTAAVRVARGRVVAFVEEHARALPGWARTIVATHDAGWTGVGTQVVGGNPGAGASDVNGLMNYGLWYAPVERGEVKMLPGHNASYLTRVLLGYGEELESLLRRDLVLHSRLLRDGHRLFIEPAARFAHLNENRFRSLAQGVFWYHRAYGPLRAAEGRWSPARRALYVAAAPAVPFYYLWNFARMVLRKKLLTPLGLVRAVPGILFVQLWGAIGQAAGLVAGEGPAADRFTRYELAVPRLLVSEWRNLGGRGAA